MFALRYFAPAPALRDLVSAYYSFEVDLPYIRDLQRAELGQMRFILQGDGNYFFEDGRIKPCPRASLTGPTSAPLRFEATGPLHVFGIGLMPAGWHAMIGCAADEIADDVTDLTSVIGLAATQMLERLGNAASNRERAAITDTMLLGLLSRARAVPYWFTQATNDWLTATPSPRVDELLARVDVSVRQVERLSKRIYGASPKLLARKYRILQAAIRMGTGQAPTWLDAAGDSFFDQSHFIRDFKQFTGYTPRRFVIEGTPLMNLTIKQRRMLPGLSKLAFYS